MRLGVRARAVRGVSAPAMMRFRATNTVPTTATATPARRPHETDDGAAIAGVRERSWLIGMGRPGTGMSTRGVGTVAPLCASGVGTTTRPVSAADGGGSPGAGGAPVGATVTGRTVMSIGLERGRRSFH